MELIRSLVGLLLAASDLLLLIAAYWLVSELAKRRATAEGLDPDQVGDASFWLAAGAVVGGRLVYILPTWPLYLRYPFDLVRVQGGLTFYGAAAGVLAAALWLRPTWAMCWNHSMRVSGCTWCACWGTGSTIRR